MLWLDSWLYSNYRGHSTSMIANSFPNNDSICIEYSFQYFRAQHEYYAAYVKYDDSIEVLRLRLQKIQPYFKV